MTLLVEPVHSDVTAAHPAPGATSRTRPSAPADSASRRIAARRASIEGSPTHAALSDHGDASDDRDGVEFPIARRRPGLSAGWDTWPLRRTDPDHVEGFRLHTRLGSGGSADVFAATGPTGLPVAIKIFRSTDRSIEVCRREFRLAYAVDPHCTAPVLGYGISPAGAYLVTVYLPDHRCGSTLVGSAMPVDRLWPLAAALASTLAAIHARGVIHCDVKPSNLLVRGDDVRLIDFGIARYVDQRSRSGGTVECSRGWAAPEQLTSAVLTEAVDVFAWGCLIAFLAAGVHPFASTSIPEWMLRVQSSEPDLCGLPLDLAEVVGRTLARDPHARPSAANLATLCRSRQPRPPDAAGGGRTADTVYGGHERCRARL